MPAGRSAAVWGRAACAAHTWAMFAKPDQTLMRMHAHAHAHTPLQVRTSCFCRRLVAGRSIAAARRHLSHCQLISWRGSCCHQGLGPSWTQCGRGGYLCQPGRTGLAGNCGARKASQHFKRLQPWGDVLACIHFLSKSVDVYVYLHLRRMYDGRVMHYSQVSKHQVRHPSVTLALLLSLLCMRPGKTAWMRRCCRTPSLISWQLTWIS